MHIAKNTDTVRSTRREEIRKGLMKHAAFPAMLMTAIAAPAYAEEAVEADPVASTPVAVAMAGAQKMVEETNRYYLALSTQIFDGSQDFSHSQIASIARMRRGDESWAMLNLGDGAVVIEGRGKKTAASAFRNMSGTEQAFRYDYRNKTLAGDDAVAGFHNRYVRPLLDQGPALGRDAVWETGLPVSNLGIAGISQGNLAIKLSRDYFVYEGKQFVLLRYEVPSFTYASTGGSMIVHWAKGAALTDPGFGEVYWNAAFHRAVANGTEDGARPYRFTRSAVAVDSQGKALFDLRKIPEARDALAELTGQDVSAVMAYADNRDQVDRSPIALAANLDALALTLAENSANQTGALAKASVSGSRGMMASNRSGTAGVSPQVFADSLGIPVKKVSDGSKGWMTDQPSQNQSNVLTDMQTGLTKSGEITQELTNELSGANDYRDSAASAAAAGQGASEFQSNPLGVVKKLAEERKAQEPNEPMVSVPVPGIRGGITAVLDIPKGPPNTPGWMTQTPDSSNQDSTQQNVLADLQDAFDSDLSALEAVSGQSANEAVQNAGANAMTGAGSPFSNPGATGGSTVAEELTHTTSQGGQGSTGASLADEVSAETLNALNASRQNSSTPTDPFANVRGGGNSNTQFGNQVDPADAGIDADDAVGTTDQVGSISKGIATFLENVDNFESERNALVNRISRAKDRYENAKGALETLFENAIKNDLPFEAMESEYNRLVKVMDSSLAEVARNEPQIARLAKEQSRLSRIASQIGADKLSDYVERFGDSSAGKALGGVGKIVGGLDHLFNVNTTLQAGENVFQDTSSGNIALTRDYDSALGSAGTIVLEMGSLVGDFYTGNWAGFASDATAITTGSASDLFVSYKGYLQSLNQQIQASEETVDISQRRTQQLKDRYEQDKQDVLDQIQNDRAERARKAQADWDAYYNAKYTGYHPNWDPKTNSWKPGTRQWREEQERLKQQTAEDKDGGSTKSPVRVVRTPSIDNGPSYPKARERTEGDNYDDLFAGIDQELEDIQIGQTSELSDEQLAAIDGDDDDFDLTAYQNNKLEQKRRDQERRNKERAERIKNSSLSKIDPVTFDPVTFDPVKFDPVKFDPVKFDPVTWEPPKWEPPEWVPLEFDAPDFSGFEWTNFADDDWDFGGHVPSFNFGNMSGKVATDLSRWEEWLRGQDIRKLERLARQAGYPNLASALADFENLMRDANDSGWRQWALAPPSCTGYVGCGPQYLERWTAKRSRLALGDILNMDRDFFSSAGLSDIQIAGLFLIFSIIDFGIDDGDRVSIVVTQFGQTLLSQTLTISTSGTEFRVPVRPGVVSVLMTALNTGEFPPNTAALSIQGVTGGEADQNYSLDDGEQAGLKVTVGRN